MKPNHQPRRHPAAFTLIELLVVIIIIAALAALIVPNIGMFGRSTDMAVSAKTQSDLSNSVQQFFVLQKRYPQGLDSLLDTAGAIYAEPGLTNADNQTYGLPYAGADGAKLGHSSSSTVLAQLEATTLDNGSDGANQYRRSLTRSGFDWVFDHVTTAGVNSNNSATTFRALLAGVAPAGVTPVASDPASIRVAELTGPQLLAKLVPQGLKPGERVVAFGVGPRNTATGKTLTNTPLYPGADGKYYGRYIVYFKVYASGERATLVGVSDSYGRTPDYTQQQFNESLPDGARQG